MSKAAKMTLVRRRRRDTNEMVIEHLGVTVRRTFSTRIPDGVPYDHEDSEEIERWLYAMQPPPEEVQMPVASGLGDLVSDGIDVTFVDDKREDWEIMLDIEEAIRGGLKNRAWLVHIKDAR